MADHAKIKTQIEYYLSDKNLAKDKFFREQIQTSKDGYIAISHFLNCNNIKSN
jgi:La domain